MHKCHRKKKFLETDSAKYRKLDTQVDNKLHVIIKNFQQIKKIQVNGQKSSNFQKQILGTKDQINNILQSQMNSIWGCLGDTLHGHHGTL